MLHFEWISFSGLQFAGLHTIRACLIICMRRVYVNLLKEVTWNHKRILRGSSLNASIPMRMSDKSFYRRMYRMDATDDWGILFGISDQKNTADRLSGTDKLRIEYLRAVFKPGGHYSVPIKSAVMIGAGVGEVAYCWQELRMLTSTIIK